MESSWNQHNWAGVSYSFHAFGALWALNHPFNRKWLVVPLHTKGLVDKLEEITQHIQKEWQQWLN